MKTKRFPFTDRENYIIKESVKIFGEDWDTISKRLPGRSPKQIHDRYINYLRDGLRNGPWSSQEDAVLIQMYKAIGPKWSKMMINLPGRSGNDIKNRWHKHLVKKVLQSTEMNNSKSPSGSESKIEDNMKDSIFSEISTKNEINEFFNDNLANISLDECSQKKIIDGSVTTIKQFDNKNDYLQIKQKLQHIESNNCATSQYTDNNYINNQKSSKEINQNELKNINQKQNPIRIINKVDMLKNELNSGSIIESNNISDLNSSIFNLDWEVQEFLDNFQYQNLGSLWP